MREPSCVGALVRDGRNRVFVHRRCAHRRMFPGTWDVVGGHVEDGETAEQALARELTEETGWKLRRVEAMIADWEWSWDGEVRREWDYLVEVEGDLEAPRLEPGKHDAYAWVGRDDLDTLLIAKDDDLPERTRSELATVVDRRLRDLVAKATRIRITDRLRLEPIGPEHANDLWRLHQDREVAAWHGGRYTMGEARGRAASAARAWESDGVDKWMAYERGTGELIGRGGLSRAEVDGRIRWEVGWTVRADRWGQGYATEIGRAALDLAFGELGATEVVAFTEHHNRRSRAVMDRLGMEYVRDFTRRGLVEGRDGLQERATFALYAIPASAYSVSPHPSSPRSGSRPPQAADPAI